MADIINVRAPREVTVPAACVALRVIRTVDVMILLRRILCVSCERATRRIVLNCLSMDRLGRLLINANYIKFTYLYDLNVNAGEDRDRRAYCGGLVVV